ncbi:hypothetical protein [Streptomyces sp. NBC_01013]|uniref:hypothetical protein n=1 Tax=Streptomyces sp. NBC_01013 TaxID=2903718 RepID=UPI00386C2B9F|nr:hypothetical protein OG538_21340 [Streptomyces sp. NBC_01013]
MHWIRVTLWGVALACFYALFSVRPHSVPLMILLYALFVLLPACGEGYAQRRRQKDWYGQFGSTEALRSIVTNEAELRRIRDEKGLLVAARRFRRQFPRCPLPEALKLVQSL